MEYLVAYDIVTDTRAGETRLRKVAKLMEGFGQRVQKSVFECVLNPAQLEQLKHRLVHILHPRDDSVRIYRLLEPRARYVEIMGRQPAYDIREPLIL
jgi:CRISPR-associated protein Cas2